MIVRSLTRMIAALSFAALIAIGCTPSTVIPAASSDASLSNTGQATPAAAPTAGPTESGLTALARDFATQTSVSVATEPPVSVRPSPTPDYLAYNIPPPDASAGSDPGNPTSPYDPNTGDPNTDNGGEPAQRPGFYHATLGAYVYEEILSVDPDVPHGRPITHGDSVNVNVLLTDPATVSRYTIPGYIFNSDEMADVVPVGDSTNVVGAMPGLNATPPGHFKLVVTTQVLSQGPGSFSLTADFVLTGAAGSMGMSGTGTHTVTATWADGVMHYHSYTDYHVGLNAGGGATAPVTVDTRQTFTIDGTLTQ